MKSDTTPEMETRFREMLMERSGEDRLLMGFDMFETARALVLASLPAGLSDTETKVQLFLRFYGAELPAETCERVIARIRRGR